MSKCKFKVGDKVRVRKDLKVDHEYKMDFEHTANCSFVPKMAKHRGKIVTIKSVYNNCRYTINESDYYWVDEMFEPVCKFKVGDMVIGNSNNYCTTNKGWIGEVTKIKDNGKFEARGRHLFGYTATFCDLDPKDFDLYTKDQPTKIVITTDGKTTTAKMYRDKTVIGVQTTKCHPDDRFDFMVGARIAFDRLVGEKKEEPKYYNGKVVCTDAGCNTTIYTTGKIYQFVDGRMMCDDGILSPLPTRSPIKSFTELQKRSIVKWLEVVE